MKLHVAASRSTLGNALSRSPKDTDATCELSVACIGKTFSARSPAHDPPAWIQEIDAGSFRRWDICVYADSWIAPVGAWIRLLRLMAGEIHPRPGPRFASKAAANEIARLPPNTKNYTLK